MGRPERVLEPDGSHLTDFAIALRQLRRNAGSPGYRELARITHYSPSTLSSAASGRSLPTLEITLALVDACGGNRDDWARRWHEIAETQQKTPPPPEPDPSTPGFWPGRRRPLMIAILIVVLIAAIVITVRLVAPDAQPAAPPAGPSSAHPSPTARLAADGTDPKDSGCTDSTTLAST